MSGSPGRPSLRQRLQELRRGYAAELPGRVGRLASPLLEGGGPSQRRLAELQAQAHALAGGAGSYGFEPVGVWARALEWALEAGAGPERLGTLARGLSAVAGQAAARTATADPPGAPRVDLLFGQPWPALDLAARLRRAGFAAAVHEDPASWPAAPGEAPPVVRVLDPSLEGAGRVAETPGAGALLALAPAPVRPPWEAVAEAAAGWYLQPPDLDLLERAVAAAAAGAPRLPASGGGAVLDGEQALRAALAERLAAVTGRGETLALVQIAGAEGETPALDEALAARCRAGDLIAPLARGGWAVALPDCGAEAAARFAREFCRAADAGALRAGVALYPLAQDAAALLAAAGEAWGGAGADGPVAVHRGDPARP